MLLYQGALVAGATTLALAASDLPIYWAAALLLVALTLSAAWRALPSQFRAQAHDLMGWTTAPGRRGIP